MRFFRVTVEEGVALQSLPRMLLTRPMWTWSNYVFVIAFQMVILLTGSTAVRVRLLWRCCDAPNAHTPPAAAQDQGTLNIGSHYSYRINWFNWKHYSLLDKMAVWYFGRQSYSYGLPNFKWVMKSHATLDTQLYHVSFVKCSPLDANNGYISY